ncbi:hypothetical protein [Sphingomonas sp. 3P27F8]|uniref:hypothetical protein n=1 Tax=Sphingomonas sp. 3P27F8 TaxID=2502213 RepID=UPI001485826F|nr:hypothetical protein [Sphingomonas sp. 3P27F8]
MTTTIERALELAREGVCLSAEDIRRRLGREGYEGVHQHLAGQSIIRQLRAELAKHRIP